MATTNPISSQTTVAEQPPPNLLVLAAAMPSDEFEGALANLCEAFSAESLIVATPNEHVSIGQFSVANCSRPAIEHNLDVEAD